MFLCVCVCVLKLKNGLDVVMHTLNLSMKETEAERPGLHGEL